MKILVIQTAFIGDAILATPVLEKLHKFYPTAELDILVRKGNESLFSGHPFLHQVLVWDKKQNKFSNLLKIASEVKKSKYDRIINLHRFASSGFIVFRSGARQRMGFDKNPFSFCYTKKVKHEIGNGKHEVERNIEVISSITDSIKEAPKLYPQPSDEAVVKEYKGSAYICIAPSSVWFTKQYPAHKWIEFIKDLDTKYSIYLLGAASDNSMCEEIKKVSGNSKVINLAGKLSFLQTAALMQGATMNYVNDSAPMHIASAVNAPVTAVFCSTIPAFGFGPLSQKSFVVETTEKLSCRPCGLHGYKSCPKGHFKCAETITTKQLLDTLNV
jgi:heptosyltransferase-2